jgi:carboxymethylenebutenolidase
VLKFHLVAVFLMTGTLVSGVWQESTTKMTGGSKPPVVTATDAPAGTESLPVTWVSVAVPDLGVMRAAVARPSGAGPFPTVLVLHGTHGFARQYVEWASDLARGGFIAVAACWFSGGGGAGAKDVTPPIPCPDMPPLVSGDYPHTVQAVDALVQATRALAGARVDRLGLVGHSRGGRATQQYLLAKGNVQAAVLHSSGYALRPWNRAAEFNVPILIMHGTADTLDETTQFGFAREFERALRTNVKPVETAYCEGCGHNTFFTNSAQRDDELKRMTEFLRRHLGK